MTDPGAPRHGRHASPDDGWTGLPTGEFASSPAQAIPVQPRPGAGHLPGSFSTGPGWDTVAPWELGPPTRPGTLPAEHLLGRAPAGVPAAPYLPSADDAAPHTGGGQVAAGLLEGHRGLSGVPQARHRPFDEGSEPAGETGPVPPAALPTPSPGNAAPTGDGRPSSGHPSGPLPPFPPSAWSRLAQRRAADAGEETQATEALLDDEPRHDDTHTEPQSDGPADEVDWDATGGLDVIGAHVDQHDTDDTDVHPGIATHELGEHGDPAADADADQWDADHDGELEDEVDADPDGEQGPLALDDDVPMRPYDPRRSRRRRRRRRVAVLVSLVVLAGLALGVVLGGRQVLGLVNPPDYEGSGTGSVQIRVDQGDSLKAIGQTMVDKGVIASVRPFVKAAEGNPQATSISPGTYALRSHMSSRAALDLLLQPTSRLVSRVTLPEGLTAALTLQKVAQLTGTPLDQLQAAAADPAAIGLPAYAGGKVEGFLFPATYDFEPGTTPTQMLQAMVERTVKSLDGLGVPEAQRLQLLTEASIVQAEGKTPDDMAKIARVLDNRIAIGMPLQLDTTVNYANGKGGVTTTAQDRANPSPYNTYVHPGLPPGPISNPGEDALRAVLSPAQGTWLYFVVIDPDTGETRFATTAQEAQANTALFQQWLREHPGR